MSSLNSDVVGMIGKYANTSILGTMSPEQKWTAIKEKLDAYAIIPNISCIDILYKAYITGLLDKDDDNKLYFVYTNLYDNNFRTSKEMFNVLMNKLTTANMWKLGEYCLRRGKRIWFDYFSDKASEMDIIFTYSLTEHPTYYESIFDGTDSLDVVFPKDKSYNLYCSVMAAVYSFIDGKYNHIPYYSLVDDKHKFIVPDTGKHFGIFVTRLFACHQLSKDEQLLVFEHIPNDINFSRIVDIYNQDDKWLWNEIQKGEASEYEKVGDINSWIEDLITYYIVEGHHLYFMNVVKHKKFLNTNLKTFINIINSLIYEPSIRSLAADVDKFPQPRAKDEFIECSKQTGIVGLISRFDYIDKKDEDFCTVYNNALNTIIRCEHDSVYDEMMKILVDNCSLYLQGCIENRSFYITAFELIKSSSSEILHKVIHKIKDVLNTSLISDYNVLDTFVTYDYSTEKKYNRILYLTHYFITILTEHRKRSRRQALDDEVLKISKLIKPKITSTTYCNLLSQAIERLLLILPAADN